MDACTDIRYEYQVGGSLQTSSPTYILRQADSDLFERLAAGEYCYVFNSRQMGKSSLRVRTQQRLREVGKLCASVDMTSIGSERVTPLQWYKGLMVDLLSKFELRDRVDFKAWWQAHDDLSMVQRLRLFIEDILLANLPERDILIFVDEIDSALVLDFPIDDFFALVRFCYNQRAEDPAYQRITWALFGVVTPSELIYDSRRTPFNIGHAIELKGFEFRDAHVLARGLEGHQYDSIALIEAILRWTEGQPFLTQKLCQLAKRSLCERAFSEENLIENTSASLFIERIIYGQIIEHWETQDNPEHLRTIRDRILRNELAATRLLGIYKTILDRETPQCDFMPTVSQDEDSANGSNGHFTSMDFTDIDRRLAYDDSREHIDLLLSGLIKNADGRLQVKNPIYKTIFDTNWVNQQLDALRPYARQIDAWINSNGTDESRLLRGRALKDAQAWSMERSVSEVDHDFLMASEQFDRKIVQQKLTSARVKETERRLESERRAMRRQRSLIVTLSGALVVAVTAGMVAWGEYHRARQSQYQTLVTAADALYAADQRLDSLIMAIDAHRFFHREESALNPASKSEMENALRRAAVGAVEQNRVTLTRSNFWDADVSPGGTRILTSSSDGEILIWNRDGTLITRFIAHESRIQTTEFFPNGELILSGGDDGLVKIWTGDGELRRILRGHTGAINDSNVSSDGRRIVTGSDDGTVRLWTARGRLIHVMKGHVGRVVGVAFSPDGKLIASTGSDRTVRIWSINGKLLKTLKGHRGQTNDAAFSPDNRILAAASHDNTVSFWDIASLALDPTQASDEVITRPERYLTGHDADVISLSFSADGNQLVTASRDQTIRRWNRDGQQVDTIRGHQGRIYDVQFAPGGELLISASADKTVRIWDITNPLATTYIGPNAGIIGIDISSDSRLIAAASDDNSLYVWERETSRLVARFPHPEQVIEADFSPDDTMIATASWDGKARLWDLDGKPLATLGDYTKPMWDVKFSPDGQTILTGGVDGRMRLWDLQGNEIRSYPGHQDEIRAIAFSPDGQRVLSAGLDKTVKIWTIDGKLTTIIRDEGRGGFIDAGFSTDGQYIAASGFDNTAKIWTLGGELEGTLSGHNAEVRSVRFSEDDKQLVTASGDGTVKLWNRKNGEILASLSDSRAPVWEAQFTQGDQFVVTGGEDARSHLWNLSSVLNAEGLTNFGCEWAKDYIQNSPNVEDRDICTSFKEEWHD